MALKFIDDRDAPFNGHDISVRPAPSNSPGAGKITALAVAFTFLCWPFDAIAESARSLINRGNTAYQAGSFDEALARYEEATVELPESATIFFNKGAALYRKSDYSAASDAFEQAALKSKKPRLGSRSQFNLGNCSFREAERQRDSDLQKSLEACQKSIQHYQEALELDPEYEPAAENIEVVRLVMKSILDEIKKQQEEQQQQQNAMREIAEKLRELIAKQESATTESQRVSDERKKQGDTQALRNQTDDLALNQKSLKNETSDLSGEMAQMDAQMRQQAQQQSQSPGNSPAQQQPPMPLVPGVQNSPLSQAKSHVDEAIDSQGSAIEKLEEYNTPSAKPYQEKAVEDLKEALAKLSEEQQNQNNQQQEQQQGEDQQQSNNNQNQDSQQQEEQQPQAQEPQQAQAGEEARDILDEEKENRERRQPMRPLGYRPVDKDW